MTVKTAIVTAGQALLKAERAFIQWWQPVATAIKGEVSKAEKQRVIAKAVGTYGVSWAGLKSALHDSGVIAEILVPLAVAAWVARLEYLARKEHGVTPDAAHDELIVHLPQEPTGTTP